MKTLIFSILAIFLIGCGQTQTIVQQGHIDAAPPAIRDSLVLRDSIVTRLVPVAVPYDSVVIRDSVVFVKRPFHIYTGSKITPRGDTLNAKFDTQTNTLSLSIGYGKWSVPYLDTMQVARNEIIQTPFLSKLGIGAIGFALCLIVLAALKLKSII